MTAIDIRPRFLEVSPKGLGDWRTEGQKDLRAESELRLRALYTERRLLDNRLNHWLDLDDFVESATHLRNLSDEHTSEYTMDYSPSESYIHV